MPNKTTPTMTPNEADFAASARSRKGHRYAGDGYSTLRVKPGVGSKGSHDMNDSLMPSEPVIPRFPRLI